MIILQTFLLFLPIILCCPSRSKENVPEKVIDLIVDTIKVTDTLSLVDKNYLPEKILVHTSEMDTKYSVFGLDEAETDLFYQMGDVKIQRPEYPTPEKIGLSQTRERHSECELRPGLFELMYGKQLNYFPVRDYEKDFVQPLFLFQCNGSNTPIQIKQIREQGTTLQKETARSFNTINRLFESPMWIQKFKDNFPELLRSMLNPTERNKSLSVVSYFSTNYVAELDADKVVLDEFVTETFERLPAAFQSDPLAWLTFGTRFGLEMVKIGYLGTKVTLAFVHDPYELQIDDGPVFATDLNITANEFVQYWRGNIMNTVYRSGYVFEGGKLLSQTRLEDWMTQSSSNPVLIFYTTQPIENVIPGISYAKQQSLKMTRAIIKMHNNLNLLQTRLPTVIVNERMLKWITAEVGKQINTAMPSESFYSTVNKISSRHMPTAQASISCSDLTRLDHNTLANSTKLIYVSQSVCTTLPKKSFSCKWIGFNLSSVNNCVQGFQRPNCKGPKMVLRSINDVHNFFADGSSDFSVTPCG